MTTMTTTDLAADFECTPRELRKFLRSDASGIESVGKGSRYALPGSKREVTALKKRFAAWSEAKATPAEEDAPEVDISDESPDFN